MSITEVPLISIVDDDLSVLEATVSLLESVGFAAKGFGSAEDFLNSPQLCRTACLILDVRMPGMGGFELQRRLAAGNDHTPIIFITAHGDQDISSEALPHEAMALLGKPFGQESLLDAVHSALARRRGPTEREGPN